MVKLVIIRCDSRLSMSFKNLPSSSRRTGHKTKAASVNIVEEAGKLAFTEADHELQGPPAGSRVPVEASCLCSLQLLAIVFLELRSALSTPRI